MKTDSSFDENYFYIDPNFIASVKSFSKNKGQLSNHKFEAIQPEIILQFETKLGLFYISEKTSEGNLCFSNHEEIRADFKQTFTKIDILNYINAFLHLPINKDLLKIPYPKDTKTFWELVKKGYNMQ